MQTKYDSRIYYQNKARRKVAKVKSEDQNSEAKSTGNCRKQEQEKTIGIQQVIKI